MNQFNYEAYNQRGRKQIGLVEALTKAAAVNQLSAYGLKVIKLRIIKGNRWLSYLSRFVELAIFLVAGFLFVKAVLLFII